jgi:ABC-2 type transport system ATP-binding protein
VYENLRIYANLYGVPDPDARIDGLASDLDLTPLLTRPTGRLSSGQKTRVALAKALLNEPDVLLLDEPTASLDPDTADFVRRYLSDYQNRTGATILLASHNMTEVERLCDRVLMMKNGTIVDRGAPDELIRRYGRRDMEEVFLHIARDTPEADRAEAGS